MITSPAPSPALPSAPSPDPIRLVIFDCDGVLVDSERIAARVQVALGAELGWPLAEADVVERFIGRSQAAIHEQIAARLGEETAGAWWEAFVRRHAEEVDAGLTAVDGLPEALDAITLPTCVASSGSHEKMAHTLGRTGLHHRFAGRIFSATEVARGKPAPDLFLYAAQRMGVPPSACVVVEDSEPGVRAARAAGMRAFGYAGGLTAADRLAGPGTVVFDDMRELPALLAAG
ncbi:HAD family hydrolase [Streptomyces sp. BE20]|uniref:HAD family hydrolase n=1 Tax=Streptomyces sp. BE20 TaxID=3002525 RepID=UPI002E79D61A|nr:HAD family hydrolase [Streptomyces sp. BE20]MEE1821727.1 HAD family hydrolase [Streptomyces sp. BE20]